MFDDLLKTIFNETKNDRESLNESESVNENKNESENESENENESDDGQFYLKQLDNNFKDINKTKSLKDQIDTLKKK